MSGWRTYKNGTMLNIDTFFTMFKVHYDKNFYFGGEVHDFWECMYVSDGEVQVSGDENIYSLTKGDIIFHKPMELHKFTVTGDNGASVFIFSFNLEGVLKNRFENKVFSLSWEQIKILEDLLSFAGKETEKYNISLHEFPYHGLLKPSEFSDIYLQRIVSYLYQLFLSLAENDNVSPALYNPETILFKKAVDFMSENLSSNPSVEKIAASCNTSVSGIKRIFAKYGGMGVHKYFLNLKLNAAIKLLKSGFSVSEVTDKLNFCSQSYFSLAVKRETGKNPSDFKL